MIYAEWGSLTQTLGGYFRLSYLCPEKRSSATALTIVVTIKPKSNDNKKDKERISDKGREG